VEQVLNGIQQVSERGRNAKWLDADRTIWQVATARTFPCHLMTEQQILTLSGIIIIQWEGGEEFAPCSGEETQIACLLM
jgi:hypothetical protein